jgi:hypothetical protein
MSTGNMNIWITGFGDACHIEDKERWFVHILDCEGKPLTWCGTTYTFLEAKCGHLEVSVPPGCYTVFAGHSPQGAGIPPFGNRLTHVAVVRINCGDHACVTLFSPSLWYCGTWFAHAVQTQMAGLQEANIDRKTATAAVEAVRALLEKLPIDQFTENTRQFQKEEN